MSNHGGLILRLEYITFINELQGDQMQVEIYSYGEFELKLKQFMQLCKKENLKQRSADNRRFISAGETRKNKSRMAKARKARAAKMARNRG